MAEHSTTDRLTRGEPSLDRRWAARVVLAVGIVVGGVVLAATVTREPEWLGVTYRVYERAALAALRGGAVYDVPPPGFSFTYVYPPASVAVFVPFALLPGWRTGFVAFTLTELAAAVGIVWLCDRMVTAGGGDLARLDHALLGGFVLVSGATIPSLYYGQVNHHIAFALGAGLLALEGGRERRAGLAFAVPAFFKVFPAAVGVWLLRRRAWRAVAVAVAAGVGGLAAGLVLFDPALSATYVDAALLGRLEDASYSGGFPPDTPYVTLRRTAAALAPGADLVQTVAPVAALLPLLAVLYRDVSTRRRRLLAAHGTLVAVLIAVPSYVVYLVFVYPTLLPLTYLLDGWPRRLVLAGALLVAVPFTPATVERILATPPPPPAVGDAALAVLDPLLWLGSVPLYGLVLTLAGCVLASRST